MSPSAALPLTGTWSGDLAVGATPARMRWTLSQDDALVSGPVLVLVSSGTVLMNGSLSGTLSGATLTYTIDVTSGGIPSAPACTGRFAGTAALVGTPVSALDGRFNLVTGGCTSPVTSGTFTLRRE